MARSSAKRWSAREAGRGEGCDAGRASPMLAVAARRGTDSNVRPAAYPYVSLVLPVLL
jgi:hypothetical protein